MGRNNADSSDISETYMCEACVLYRERKTMTKMEIRLSKRMKGDLEMVATVDEITQMQVVRDALSEYFEGLDMKWYRKEFDDLEISPKDIEKFESESDEDDGSDEETEEESEGGEGTEEETKE